MQERQISLDISDSLGVTQVEGDGSGGVQVGLGESQVAGRRLEPAGQEQARQACARRGGRRSRVANPCSTGSAVAEDNPGPAEPGRDLDA
jgi:hypothetical protein